MTFEEAFIIAVNEKIKMVAEGNKSTPEYDYINLCVRALAIVVDIERIEQHKRTEVENDGSRI